MTIPPSLFENALADAALTVEGLDRLHADLLTLIEHLQADHLWSPLPVAFTHLLTAFEHASLQALVYTHDPALHYAADGRLHLCPVCGSSRITTLSTQHNRGCCAACGLPCDSYADFVAIP